MSVTGIGGAHLTQLSNIQRQYQQVQNEFKQLGQDLQAGNLSEAQTDYVTLSQAVGSQLGSNSPIAKTLGTIGQALQSGNVSAAQQAFSALSSGHSGVSHRNQRGAMQGSFEQVWNQMGQALQSGNVSAAQQAFSAVQQIWQQGSGSTTATSATATTT